MFAGQRLYPFYKYERFRYNKRTVIYIISCQYQNTLQLGKNSVPNYIKKKVEFIMESSNQQSSPSQAQTASQNIATACATGAVSGLLVLPVTPLVGCLTGVVVQAAIELVRPSAAN